ncbi:MAG: potassium channel protein [Candidatus Zixiibacteriota bacterium]
MEPEKKIKWLLLLMLGVILYGTLGYTLIERWPVLDSLYMTIITLSTVGFREVRILSSTGKIFTIILVIFGVGGAAYTVSVIGRWLIGGEMREILGRRKMEKQLKDLKDHYIVCGYGRVGMQVCKEFSSRKATLVVIDKNPEKIEELHSQGILAVEGDCTDDLALEAAGIQKAKALISTVVSESENVFVSLSARQFNPQIFITARAESSSAEKKLLRAGADRVVFPHQIGGIRMALVTLRPDIVDFMRAVGGDEKTGFAIEEIEVLPDSSIAETTLRDSPIRCELGILVVGIKKRGKEMVFNPSADTRIEAGDILIVIGETKKLEIMGKLTQPEEG